MFQHWALGDREKSIFSPPFHVCFFLACSYGFIQNNTVYLSFPGKEERICLSTFLWVKGAVEVISCTTNLLIPEVERLPFPALSLQCQAAAESVPSLPITKSSGWCSRIVVLFLLAVHLINIPTYALTCSKLHVSVFATLLTSGLGALLWWLVKGVFHQSCSGKRYGEVFVKKSCAENMKKQADTLIRMTTF